jgi:hypothetical protein
MKDWTGNGNSIYKTLGASNHTEKERQKNDYYATEPHATELLLEKEKFSSNIWECACGGGVTFLMFLREMDTQYIAQI